MTIAYICLGRMPTEKAYGLQIAKTLEALQARALVTLIYPERKNHIEEPLFTYYSIKHIFSLHRLRNPFIFLESLWQGLYFPLFRLYMRAASVAYALRHSFDAIITRDIWVAYVLALFGKPAIYEDHEPKQSFAFIYHHMVKTIKKKVLVAAQLKTLYERIGVDSESYKHIPNGVDIDHIEKAREMSANIRKILGIQNDLPLVLYMGHFYTWKGVYTLVDSAKDINANVILLGGTTEDFDALREYVKETKAENVFLHPFVPQREALNWLVSADVLVLPNTATEHRSASYTTPLKMFEYMASGVPVVASDIPSFRTYLHDQKNALLCPADKPNDLAESVNTLLKDRDLGKRLADHAKKDVSMYSWENRAESIITFLSTSYAT